MHSGLLYKNIIILRRLNVITKYIFTCNIVNILLPTGRNIQSMPIANQ